VGDAQCDTARRQWTRHEGKQVPREPSVAAGWLLTPTLVSLRILLFPQAVETDPCLGYDLEGTDWGRSSLSVVVLGASGDLAKKKIFPALFALYYEGLLPEVNTAEYIRSFVVVLVCVCLGGGSPGP
jgi:hypothetical protein